MPRAGPWPSRRMNSLASRAWVGGATTAGLRSAAARRAGHSAAVARPAGRAAVVSPARVAAAVARPAGRPAVVSLAHAVAVAVARPEAARQIVAAAEQRAPAAGRPAGPGDDRVRRPGAAAREASSAVEPPALPLRLLCGGRLRRRRLLLLAAVSPLVARSSRRSCAVGRGGAAGACWAAGARCGAGWVPARAAPRSSRLRRLRRRLLWLLRTLRRPCARLRLAGFFSSAGGAPVRRRSNRPAMPRGWQPAGSTARCWRAEAQRQSCCVSAGSSGANSWCHYLRG